MRQDTRTRTFLVGAMVCGMTLGALARPSSADYVLQNTIAYWPFDEGKELADATGKGNTLENNTGVSFSRESATFDGIQALLKTAGNLTLGGYSNLTVECFFCVTNQPADFGFLVNAGTYDSSGNIALYCNPSFLTADIHYPAGTYDQERTGSNPFTLGKWHHVAMVIDGSKTGKDQDRLQLYMDNIRCLTIFTNTTSFVLSNKQLFIGAKGNGTQFFKGRIDDIRITSEVLSTNAFMKTRTGYDIVTYWPFEKGRELADASGHGNSLTNNGVSFSRGAAIFDGNQSAFQTVANLQLSPYRDLTVECFVWTTNAHLSAAGMILSHSTYATAGEFDFYISGRKLFGEFFSTANGFSQVKSPSDLVTGGQWCHIALVLDSSMTSNNLPKLFVDRIRLTNDIPWFNASIVKLANKPFYIGQIAGGFRFNGRIDDVRICDAVLETNEFMTARSIPPPGGTTVLFQ